MKDLTHYFQSPTKDDESSEEFEVSIKNSSTRNKSVSSQPSKTTLPHSKTHAVRCDRDSEHGSDNRRRRKKNESSSVILDVETVSTKSENIIVTSSEMQSSSQICHNEIVTSSVSKNSTKILCKEDSKWSNRSSIRGLKKALNSSLNNMISKSCHTDPSGNLKRSGPDAFEVLMSVHVRNVDDECTVECGEKEVNGDTSCEVAASNFLRKASNRKRKHNLEEMARRKWKCKNLSDNDFEKQNKKWKRVKVVDSESEDVSSECREPGIEETVISADSVDCEIIADNTVITQNTKGVKVKPRAVKKKTNVSTGSVVYAESLGLETDEKLESSSCDLSEHDVLMVQYEKTLKHVRKAEKALRKYEKLKNLQERKTVQASASKLKSADSSALEECHVAGNSDIQESSPRATSLSRKNSSRSRQPSDSESEHLVLLRKGSREPETAPSLSDEKVFENSGDTKRDSIFSYFSKVSKEEVLSKPERLSVKVLIHSPPTTPLKKTMRTVSYSQTSRGRRKSKMSQGPKEVPDTIDVLSSEVVEIVDGVEEDVTVVSQSSDGGRKSRSLRSWKVRVAPDVASLVDSDPDKCEQEQAEDQGDSDSERAATKKGKSVKRARSGRRGGKLPAPQGQDVSHAHRTSRRLAMKSDAPRDDVRQSSSSMSAGAGRGRPRADESSDKLPKPSVVLPRAVKLAPVFLQEKSRNKNKIDPAVMEARKNFLMSGVPDAVQKMINIQKSFEDQSYDAFPEVSHVQQVEEGSYIWNLPRHSSLILRPDSAAGCDPARGGSLMTTGMFTNAEPVQQIAGERGSPPLPITAFRGILRELKRESPDFPVYRMFRALRCKFLAAEEPASEDGPAAPEHASRKTKRRARNVKSGRNDQRARVLWTEKYRPACVDDLFSNLTNARHLRSWLESWKTFVREMNAAETAANLDKSGDESFVGDDENSGSDDGAMPSNGTVLVGPAGCGKTAVVYAVASELDCKVLEINASSKRTGKRVLSEFLEATQSHQVRKSSEQSAASIKGFFKEEPRVKSKKRRSKLEEPERPHPDDNSKKLSVILVEDADLVFEDQDEGFSSALTLLLTSSKRPVVLTTTDPACPHLSKLMQQYCVLHFTPPSPRLISVWLQLVSLLEGSRLSNPALQRLFSWCAADMRRTIHSLQLRVQASASHVRSRERLGALGVASADDDSGLADEEDPVPAPVRDAPLWAFGRGDFSLGPCMGALWWNVGSLVGVSPRRGSRPPRSFGRDGLFREGRSTDDEELELRKCGGERTWDDGEDVECTDGESQNVTGGNAPVLGQGSETEESSQNGGTASRVQMDAVCRLANVLSDACVVYAGRTRLDGTIDAEPCARPWDRPVKDGISTRDDVCPCRFAEMATLDGICSYLVQEGIEQCRTSLCVGDCKKDKLPKLDWSDALIPSADKLRRRSQKHAADDAATAAIAHGSWLDRGAVCLDYNPLLRAVGRLERSRMAANAKRRNRFFNYLTGLGIDTTESVLATMCSIFEES